MKFLCVPCDQPMRLAVVQPPDRGSLTVRYACPECGYEMAMLTNPFETDMVRSLGVKIGPEGRDATRAAEATSASEETPVMATASGTPSEGASRCPFASMIPGLAVAAEPEETAPLAGMAAPSGTAPASGARAGANPVEPIWTDAANERLKVIPFFVRPMAKTGIERFAKERGYATIDERVLDEAKSFFGM